MNGLDPAAEPEGDIRVLLVEDNAADVLLIRTMLGEARLESFSFNVAQTLSSAIAELGESQAYDIILLDLTLPDSHGLQTFTALLDHAADVPVIVLSGMDDERLAMRTVHMGAQDYLVKGKVDHVLLLRAVRYGMERKRVERKLRESEAFYQSLVENLPQNIVRKDVNGCFTFANQRFCNELGMSIEEIIGKTDFDFFPPEMAAKYQDDDRAVMSSGEIYDATEEHVNLGGERVYVQVVKTPIYSDTGQIIGTQILFWDVTEKKLADERLRQAHSELERSREDLLKALEDLQRSHNELKETQLQMIEMEKLQTVGQLAAGVAHEVKNPLAILRMGVEFLSNAKLTGNDDVPTILRDMTDAIQRADSIIMGLLDFSAYSRVDEGDFDINDLVKESFRLVRHEFVEPDYLVRLELLGEVPPAIGDQNKIKQVLVNLFTNAYHAMPEGGELVVRTTLTRAESDAQSGARDTRFFARGEHAIRVEIDDNGTGIAPDKLNRIFDPFYTTKPTGQGTGLGLSVTKKILELHHGSIEVQNRSPHGVRVTIVLPTKRS
jgi:two-component system, NtrC family, sensor kinase